jgi:hypothetical protein
MPQTRAQYAKSAFHRALDLRRTGTDRHSTLGLACYGDNPATATIVRGRTLRVNRYNGFFWGAPMRRVQWSDDRGAFPSSPKSAIKPSASKPRQLTGSCSPANS